jgi:hypothetical protein
VIKLVLCSSPVERVLPTALGGPRSQIPKTNVIRLHTSAFLFSSLTEAVAVGFLTFSSCSHSVALGSLQTAYLGPLLRWLQRPALPCASPALHQTRKRQKIGPTSLDHIPSSLPTDFFSPYNLLIASPRSLPVWAQTQDAVKIKCARPYTGCGQDARSGPKECGIAIWHVDGVQPVFTEFEGRKETGKYELAIMGTRDSVLSAAARKDYCTSH